MHSTAAQVVATVIFSLLIFAFTGAGLYGLLGNHEDGRGDRIGGASICLLLIVALAFGIVYVWA